MSYLTRGIIALFLIFFGINITLANKADLSFLEKPDLAGITTVACHQPILETYTIIAGTPEPLTLQRIALESHDDFPNQATSIVHIDGHSCKQGQTLAKDHTCTITISFQPCSEGTLNRNLIIEMNTSQGVLETTVSTQIKKVLLQIGAGNSANSSGLIIQSQDNGVTWSNVTEDDQDLVLPSALNFPGASCNLNSTCIVAGWDQTGTSPPLLVTTLDTGVNWTIVDKVYDTNNQPIAWPQTGRFDNASCGGNNCIAMGIDEGAGDVPLLFNSRDAGATWYKRSIISGPTTGELFGGSCNENNLCVIVGAANTPILSSSSDGGATWNLITALANGDPFPAHTAFFDTNPSCSNVICIAGGDIRQPFHPPSPEPQPMPFLISSTSPGQWNQVTNALPVSGSLGGFACSGNNCVAVGNNVSSGNILIVNTKDAGKTWTQITTLTNAPLPSGGLNNVSCYNNNCVAGSSDNNGPLLLSSQDGGATWMQITTASGEAGFPDYGIIETTGCSSGLCMAAGGDITHPTYLLTSFDGGKTWHNVDDIVLPSDGLINAVSISR